LVLVLVFIGCVTSAVGLAAPNPPTTGAYASGVYRNLFAEYGQSQSAITTKINAAWTSLFGGGSSSTVYYTVGTDMAYILDVADNDVRTEGMSYGMMIAVQMNEQTYFDALYKWAVTYMRYNNPSSPNWLYYNWQLSSNGTVLGTTPASDGETYFVTALIFAAGRWGSSANFNYVTEYKNLLYKMLHVPTNTQGVTNLFDASSHQVTFCPIGSAATYTDPSYHTPAFYGVWALVANTTADQTFWTTAQSASRDYFQKAFNSLGLNPDYSNFDGSLYTGNTDHQYFGFDAWRTIQNVGVDYAWWAADSREITLVNTVLNFFNSKGTYGNEYYMNGTAMSTTHSQGHVSMNTAGGLASNNNVTWNFVKEMWNYSPPTGTYRYYDGMLYFLSLLHVTGNFKIYLPSTSTTVAAAASSSSSSSSSSSHATTASSSTTHAPTTSTSTTHAPATTSSSSSSSSHGATTTTSTSARITTTSTTGSTTACSTVSITVNVTESWGGSSPTGNLELIVHNTGTSKEITTLTVTFSTPLSTLWSGIAAGSTSGQYVVTANAAVGSTVTVSGATFTGQTTAPAVTVVSIVCG